MRILRPADPAEAVRELSRRGPSARLAAGTTGLQLEWAAGAAPPEELIDLSRIADLRGIEADGGWVRLGAATRLADIEADRIVARDLPLLAFAVRGVAAPGIRTLATLGGNVAGRTGCLLPCLLALDAELDLFTASGARRHRLADWLAEAADPAGLIVAIRIRAEALSDRSTQRKIGLRAAFTPSVVGVAGILVMRDGIVEAARLAIGGGPVRARRLAGPEALLTGRPVEAVDWPGLHAALLAAIEAPDDAFRTGRYRRLAAANALVSGLSGRSPSRLAAPRRRDPIPVPPPAEREISRLADPARWRERPDIADKVHGRFAYLTDERRPDMLVARILRAGRPHARILAIETAAAEALPGVAAIVTHRDVPGLNAYGILVQDQPALCDTRVRYVGDAVAAVAAIDAEVAAAALALIRVDYEDMPVLDDPIRALEPDVVALHDGGNLRCEIGFTRGDHGTLESAFAACAHVVEETYVTPRQMHGFLETEGGWAVVEPDGILTIRAGGQHGARDRKQVARILGWPESRIRVVTSPTGGAFGGKDELTVQPALALLAVKTGRPVRLHLDRAESVAAGWKRNPMRIAMRTGCDAKGRLVAQQVDLVADNGAYASLSPSVVETALEHACGPYEVPTVATRGRLVATNNGVCGAFRGFGANEMAFAVESQIGRLAERVGLDPVAMRRLNLRRPGAPGYLGQGVGPSERLAEMLDAAAASPLWAAPRSQEGWPAGVGMALNHQGNGLGSLPEDAGAVELRLAPDGMVEAAYGLDEMGQGLLTAIKTVVADALGIAREDVRPVVGDTGLTPDSGSTTAARSSYVIWKGAALAGPPFARQLREATARLHECEADDLVLAPGGVRDARSNSGRLLTRFAELARAMAGDHPAAAARFDYPKADHTGGNARFLFASGAVLARVAVDPVSGAVRVLDLHQHTAAGPVIDPAAYLGQIEGGGLQGLGFTLTEHALMAEARYLTGNLDTYLLPTVADAPRRSRVAALEGLDPGDPYGPRGVGEMGIGAVTPAIAAAIADAIGHWPARTPLCPERMLDVMTEARMGGAG